KQRWVAQRPDLASHPQFIDVAGKWHRYATEVMRVPDDSPEYVSCMNAALEPTGYEPLPTPDDVIKTINATSRYGKNLTAAEYNQGVNRLIDAKARGEYPDKQ